MRTSALDRLLSYFADISGSGRVKRHERKYNYAASLRRVKTAFAAHVSYTATKSQSYVHLDPFGGTIRFTLAV